MNTRTALAALCLLAGGAGAAEPAPAGPGEGYGLSKAQAVEVCRPRGEHAYLARLICPDREHPRFERVANFGERNPVPDTLSEADHERLLDASLEFQPLRPGEVDHHIVDGYDVVCGERTTRVYLDMYHCDAARPKQAPPGFGIID